MPEFSDYLETRTQATGLTGAEILGASQGGDAVAVLISLLSQNRGDYAGTTAFPSSGGTFTAGAPRRGDRWRLTAVLTVDGNVYAPGLLVEAAVDVADPDTPSDWNIIQTL